MAAAIGQVRVATPTGSSSNPSTPPYPHFPRLPHTSSATPSIQRNASTSSSHSTTTNSSTSSLAAVPMRPPPSETRTAATSSSQMGTSVTSGYTSEGSSYGGRGYMWNGPRSEMSRHGTLPIPSIHTSAPPHSPLASPSSPLQERSTTLPITRPSPTTPRAPSAPWSADLQSPDTAPRVTITASGPSSPASPRGRGVGSIPLSPSPGQPRTLSVGVKPERDLERERRMSQASNASSSGSKKPSARDWVFGEEIGRGSYSTVVRAVPASTSVSNVRSDREYAVKIMNQQHLIAEKKAKYAVIERDALIRLSQPRGTSMSPTTRHVRGASGSSARRKSNASVAGSAKDIGVAKERLSIAISDSSSGSGPLSPTLLSGRRPSRSAEPPTVVLERSEEVADRPRSPMMRSRPPSPVKEETSSQGHGDEEPITPGRLSHERNPPYSRTSVSPDPIKSSATPKKRRTSFAPSERSVKTISAGRSGMGPAHPGVIRLYSTFNDKMSLYYVLELASNGELLDLIRKNGSLDTDSTRYYAAQLIDTIEYIHEREIIHRDLKPENILLDANFRVKVTDFGSAKIIGRDTDESDTKKRSFVGSADFVSPEVLRNEPAVLASDIWAFGCIVFQLLTGKPPFRGATDYLTFQKILKREFEYPTGFDEEARSLIELVLNPDPTLRPSATDIKSHPFFASIDFTALWTCPVPVIHPGLTKPIESLANPDSNSDVWDVFDDEVSDGGFEYDDDAPTERAVDGLQYDGTAAADAVRHNGDDLSEPRYPFQDAGSEGDSDLQPPRPSFVDASPRGKWGRGRLGSKSSARTSSSSSTNRHALSGLLESLKLQGGSSTPVSAAASKVASGRNSRMSDRSNETRMQGEKEARQPVQASEDPAKWSSLLLANENIIYTSTILVRPPTTISLPNFLMPAPKRRQLILTDFPRLFTVKEEISPASLSVKSECVFVAHSQRKAMGRGEVNARVEQGAAGWVLDVQDKGVKGFTVQTTTQSLSFTTDTPELKKEWMGELKKMLN